MTKDSSAASARKADPAATADPKVKLSAEALAARMPKDWQGDGTLIWREWTFPTYLDGVHFAERVAQQAEAVKHHPDLLITYKKVRVSYTTHDAGGVTALDLEEAASLDDLR
jgi:4a-hydroxytetrahydrobiopterin dehydratase